VKREVCNAIERADEIEMKSLLSPIIQVLYRARPGARRQVLDLFND
jgi:hypothetical protein